VHLWNLACDAFVVVGGRKYAQHFLCESMDEEVQLMNLKHIAVVVLDLEPGSVAAENARLKHTVAMYEMSYEVMSVSIMR